MKYFGEKSLSSVLSTLFKIAWWVILIGAVIGGIFGFMFIPNGQRRTRRHNVYGRSFAGQTVSTGSYLDTITATVTF